MSELSPPAATETHLSWVFFTPDRAYKLLKPVAMPFIEELELEMEVENLAVITTDGWE